MQVNPGQLDVITEEGDRGTTVESFIFVGLKFRGFQISDKLVGI